MSGLTVEQVEEIVRGEMGRRDAAIPDLVIQEMRVGAVVRWYIPFLKLAFDTLDEARARVTHELSGKGGGKVQIVYASGQPEDFYVPVPGPEADLGGCFRSADVVDLTIIERERGGFYLEGRNGVWPTEDEVREVAANILRETGGAVEIVRINGMDETYEVKPRTADTGTCEIVSNEGGPVAAVIDGQRYRLRREEPGEQATPAPKVTYGEYLVGAGGEESPDGDVAEVKADCAEIIDKLHDYAQAKGRPCEGTSLLKLAARQIETACMHAVKGLTKEPWL